MKKHLLIGLAAAIALYSCNGDTDPINDSSIILNSDSESLSARVKLDNAGVISVVDPNAPAGRIQEEASNLPLILVSQVDAPEFDGKTLKATHVDIDGNYAYVSYNTEGSEYLGAVDIFDITNIYSPVITEQAIFTDTDISALEYKNGTLYLAAAVNIDENTDVTSPANLITVSVANGRFTSDFSYTSMPGFVATDVANTNTNTAVTSGNAGIIGLFDATQTPGNSTEMEDLRAVAFGNDRLAVLSGATGVHILDPNSLSEVVTIPLASDVAGAKRTLDIDNGNLYVSEGANGAGIYKMNDGTLVQKLAIPIRPDDVEPGDIVTNAVSVDQNLLFMANGAAGISISDVSDLGAIKVFGVLDLDGSSNFVRNEEEFVFVATGFGGLQILKINQAEEPTDVSCEGLSPYSGNANLNVNSNETQAYSGAASLKNVNIGGTFLFCGSLAVEQNLNVNSNGLMTVKGSFAFGQYQKNSTLNINSQSKLQLQGSTVIYGDLRLNSGATLEFLGEGNSITVYGTVTVNSGAQIIGDFTDTEGKFN
ncbi:hypothetical protein PBT90_00125 [Algoriphagus halophytocola]|uniref:LVIVD repeat-containing protein n=1 Tax=Algoriphagus halophytocola TaxID=2991499 RepID=A0ABY6MI55_9BACT|nr:MULTISPECIES: hypothetical protein [unclassified Algoriphagus]UZD21864.1 hypothetical protein OM944_14450 [Algoriphagus sp. TR-M5]WBL43114.1 hypothetical protein PBT90_00125 [Algoriphagus sp. TR-M9]